MKIVDEGYVASLHGLLHDIGKPIIRLKFTVKESEEAVKLVAGNAVKWGELEEDEIRDFESFAEKILNHVYRKGSHEAAWELVARELDVATSMDVKSLIRQVVKQADYESASERTTAIRELEISHFDSPFLSPFGLASLSGLDTHSSITLGINDACNKIIGSIKEKCNPLNSRKCASKLISGLDAITSGNKLENLVHEPVWHPVLPIRWSRSYRDYWARTLEEAKNKNSYVEVNASLLSGLFRLQGLNKASNEENVRLDMNQTLTAINRRSLIFVPSAVYGGPHRIVLPDLSLYAHSRVVAGIAAAVYKSKDLCGKACFRIVNIDLMGIQSYISSHRSNLAAVKALRGRSLVIELAQRAAVNYLLHGLGLPWTSVYTYEGGVTSIIAPCCKDVESIASGLEELFRREFRGRLGVAVGYTEDIDIEARGVYSRYAYDPNDPRLLTSILSRAQLNLAARKYMVEPSLVGFTDPRDLKYDPFMDENIEEDYYIEYSDVCSSPEDCEDYWGSLAGDEGLEVIREAGGISRDTHRALVAGKVSPNLIAIVEVYSHGCDKIGDMFKVIANRLFGNPSKRFGTPMKGVRLGLIDFPHLRAGYILISTVTRQEYWPLIAAIVKLIAGSLVKSGCNIKLVLTTINRVEDFLPHPRAKYTRELLESLKGGSVSLAFDWIALNTYYPVSDEGDVLDLDETATTHLVGLVKMDADSMGGVMHFMSAAPSRLATASEILSLTFGLLGYMLIRESNLSDRIYVMYMGGDDAVFFGDLPATLTMALDIEEHYSKMLPGMTISAGIAVENVKFPLHLSYNKASSLLRLAKNSPSINLLGEGANTKQGTVAVEQLVRPVSVCTAKSCQGKESLLKLEAINWRGIASIKGAIELKEDVTGAEKQVRLLITLASILSEINDRHNCTKSSIADAEKAKLFISYAYNREKLRPPATPIDPADYLAKAVNIKTSYPHTERLPIEMERLRLQLALLLSRNTLNIAYQLQRIERK